MRIPKMIATGMSTATTYHFRPEPDMGWALCTVNDTTGELTVQSDWGDFSYRWNVAHLGCPTLHHFIAHRMRHTDGKIDCHYLADKLTSSDHSKRERFSPEKTVAELKRIVIEKRRAEEISGRLSRQLFDDLTEIDHEDDVRNFVERYYQIDEHDQICKHAIEMEYLRNEPTGSFLVLLEAILPALVEAVTQRLTLRVLVERGTAEHEARC